VHRLGQRQPVRVVNFVSQGTIEEGMLGVLAFKTSLFSGVLDGGEKDVFLGGSRLTKFMEAVEKTTEAIPQAVLEEADEMSPASKDGVSPRQASRSRQKAEKLAEEMEEEQPPAAPGAAAASDPWTGLLQAGMALLQQVA